MRALRTVLSGVFAISVFAPALPVHAQVPTGAPSPPAFDEAQCPFTADDKVLEQVRCGYMTVSENWAAPSGRRLRIAVAIIRSTSPTPRPDPIVLLSGGPGDKLVDYVPAAVTRGTLDLLRADRDIVLYDQRGTGYSDPAFCPGLSVEWQRLQRLGLATAERRMRQREALAGCRDEMLRAGVDLAHYNTPTNARDLDDLRQALGYEQWNLIAVSYGTRLALEIMRTAPGGIRSAVLDGPVPSDRPVWTVPPDHFVDVLRRLAGACAAQSACAAAFPDVEQSFWRGLESLKREPLVLEMTGADGARTTTVANGDVFTSGVFTAMYTRPSLQIVPMLIHEADRRNDTTLAVIGRRVNAAWPPQRTSRGLHYTVVCFDDVPLITPAALVRRESFPSDLRVNDMQTDTTLCDALHGFRAIPATPVTSDIPTLIFTGEFDPATHRSNGPLVVRSLRHGRVVEIPRSGHAESMQFECTRTIMRDFVAEPLGSVDTSCLTSIPPLRFITDAKALRQQ